MGEAWVRGEAGWGRGRGRTTRLGEFPVSFHASQVNRGNLPKHCHICHVTLYSHTVCTGPVHTVPPTSVRQQHACAFLFFFFPSFLLTSSLLYRYREPPSRWQTARGVVTLFFTTLVRFFFFFFSIADRPFSPTCTRPAATSSRVAFIALPLLCRLRYASRRPRRPSRHASRVSLVLSPSRHASPLSCRPLATRRIASPLRHASRRASVTRPLVASRLNHASPLSRCVFVTPPPCRVASSSRVASSPHCAMCRMCGENGGGVSVTGG